MADAGPRFAPLYITAWALIGIGSSGLVCLLMLDPPSPIYRGLLYILIGFVTFGVGEIVNHPKPSPPVAHQDDNPRRFYRQRNSCSLGNLCDIGAVLLFFTGLSTLLFPR